MLKPNMSKVRDAFREEMEREVLYRMRRFYKHRDDGPDDVTLADLGAAAADGAWETFLNWFEDTEDGYED